MKEKVQIQEKTGRSDLDEDDSSDDELEMVPLSRPTVKENIPQDVVIPETVQDQTQRTEPEHTDPEQREEPEVMHHDAEDERDDETDERQEVVQEQQHNDAELEATAHAQEVEPVRELPRRSNRERKPPTWMRNQEYVFRQQHQEPLEWQKKCEYLQNLQSTNLMKGFEKEIAHTMMEILKNS